MIASKINDVLEKIEGIDTVEKGELSQAGGNKQGLYSLLEEKLGIIAINPYTILHTLLPNIHEDEITSFPMLAFILHHLNSRESAQDLKKFVEDNKSKDSHEIYDLIAREWYRKSPTDTFVWVEASSSLSGYNDFIKRLKDLAKLGKLHTMVSPASHIDAAGIESFVSGVFKLPGSVDHTKNYTDDMGNGDKKRIKMQDESGYVVFNFIITCIDKSTNKYILEIEKFYDLECKQFGAIPIIGTSISTTNVWEKLVEYVFKDPRFGPEKTEELDLCLKANKTSMDMLKVIYAMKYFDTIPDHDKYSIFNDHNLARFFAAISRTSHGLSIFIKNNPYIYLGATSQSWYKSEIVECTKKIFNPNVKKMVKSTNKY
jgi:hypothetical protein